MINGERLLKGAAVLGKLWRKPEDRCAFGWEITFIDAECLCEPKKKFCVARTQWITLALEEDRKPEYGPFSLALMMTAKEWDATGLTMEVEREQEEPLYIGPNGVCQMTDLVFLQEEPEVLGSISTLMKAFPGAKITR